MCCDRYKMVDRMAKREARKLRRRLQRQYTRYGMGLMRGKRNKVVDTENLERERLLALAFIDRINRGAILDEWDWTDAVLELYFGVGCLDGAWDDE